MSFAVAARDVLRGNRISEQRALDLGEELTEKFADVLSDDAVRREVYEEIRWDLDEISMVEVHAVLDVLIRIIREPIENALRRHVIRLVRFFHDRQNAVIGGDRHRHVLQSPRNLLVQIIEEIG